MSDSTERGIREEIVIIRVGLEHPTPEMIAAAWDAWRPRHNGQLGPGPAFVEAIQAAGQVLLARARAAGITVNTVGEVMSGERMPHMCRDGHAEIRHALSDDDERCPVCRERHRADAAEDEKARLRAECDVLMAQAGACAEEVDRVREEIRRLRIALHDAIRRPLGVTPDSALEFYDPRMADEAEARRPKGGRL